MINSTILRDIFGKSKILLAIIMVSSLMLTVMSAIIIAPLQFNVTAQIPAPLDPLSIPKFVNQLTGPPPVYVPTNVTDVPGGNVIRQDYSIDMGESLQQVLPSPLPMTKVWGYGGQAKNAVTGAAMGYVLNSPGPSFEVTKGLPIRVNWTNLITTPIQFAVDPTLHWANPNNIPMNVIPGTVFPPGYTGAQSPAPLVPHLHGGEVPPVSDGGPDAWWTYTGIQGPGYSSAIPTSGNSAVYDYININDPTTLWYHDHALGITRLNVMSGLAGFYIVRDPADTIAALLPTGKYDMPLVFQDRSFLDDGTFNFPTVGVQPAVHPYWTPEFFGDTIMVNGLVWPNMNVSQGVYRFRLLDGSNARFYTISFVVNPGIGETILNFTQIASDGGYLTAPVPLSNFTFAPAERAEILVDFSGLAEGTQILLKNTANENWPDGLPVNPNTVGQIMQFTVTADIGPVAPVLPTPLNPTLPTFPTLLPPRVTRILTLVEVLDPITDVPLELLLDGQAWLNPVYETATVGDTEEWFVFNPTADSHPIHLHLVQFQVISRQPFNVVAYYADWLALNGGTLPFTAPTQNLPNLKSYTLGPEIERPATEQGWKDTVMMNPGEITRIRIRFAPTEAPISGAGAPTPGVNPYPFDPTLAPGYVWHCHILDHEDNEMMRPMEITTVVNPSQVQPLFDAVRGDNDLIYRRTFTYATSSWGLYTPLPGGSTIDTPAAVEYNGFLYFAVRGSDGSSIWFGSLNLTSSTFSGWTSVLLGSTPSAPKLVNYGSKLYIVVRGFGNDVYYRSYDTVADTWSAWIVVPGGATCDSPAAVVVGDTLQLVVRGFSTTDAAINNTLYQGYSNLTDNTFSGWTLISGSTPSTPTLIAEQASTAVYLVIRGENDLIHVNRYDGTTWQGWTSLPLGSTTAGPGAIIMNNVIYFEVVGGGVIYYNTQHMLTGTFSGWTAQPGSTPSNPTMTK